MGRQGRNSLPRPPPPRRRPPVCTALPTFDLSPRLTAPLTPQPGTHRLRGAAPTLRTPRSPAPTPGVGESLLSRVSPRRAGPRKWVLGEGQAASRPQGCAPNPDTVPPFPHARPPGSWNLEGLRALGPLATYISSSLWMQVQQVGCSGVGGCPAGCGQGEGRPAGLPPATPLGTGVPSPSLPHPWGGRRNQGPLPAPGQGMESVCPLCQAVGLDFFGSTVATYRAGRLSQQDARRFVTGFLKAKAESVSSRPKRGTGQCGHCGPGMLCLLHFGLLTLGRAHPTCGMLAWAWPRGLHPAEGCGGGGGVSGFVRAQWS